jgi:uncharacterized protein
VTTASSSTSHPTARRSRAIAPDVARGLVLLGIAVANVVYFLVDRQFGILYRPIGGSEADTVTNVISAVLFDNRSFPLFALLFGYGITQITRREYDAGAPWPKTRTLLIRRNLFLILFGAVHGVFVFFGDIIGTYGLLGLALVFLVRASMRVLVIVGSIAAVMFVVLTAGDGLGEVMGEIGISTTLFPSTAASSYLEATGFRALEWGSGLLSTLLGGWGLLAPMIIGLAAARYRVLEEPWNHRSVLIRVAVIGLPVSVLGAIPVALSLASVVDFGSVGDIGAAIVHGVTGLIGAVAFVAIIALVVGRQRQPRGGGIARVFAALGKRSLSGYLTQSIVFLFVFAPYLGGLGLTAGVAEATLIAVGVWVATLVAANILEAVDRPGPAEWLLRKLVYWPPRVKSPAPN